MMRARLQDKFYSWTLRFCRRENLFDLTLLLMATGWLISNFPMDLLRAVGPASGGDTGSHYWPLQLLMDHGPHTGTLRIWNPGNMVGEPSLVHYFPLPFFIMYFLSWFMSGALAFNIGTALPVILLPASAYLAMLLFRCRRPIPIMAALGTLICLYNGAYSAWGGNFRSNLAGQFCHQYALIFLLLTFARFYHELQTGKQQVGSALLAAATCLSHAYVAMALPFGVLSIVLFASHLTLKERILATIKVGSLAGGLVFWWLWPSIDNNKWTTPYADAWIKNLKIAEIIPTRYWISVGFFLFLFPTFHSLHRSGRRNLLEWPVFVLFMVLALFYTAMIWVFPKLGLVDIRALPQVYLFVIIGLMINFGFFTLQFKNHWWEKALVLIAATAIFYSSLEERKTIKSWTQWNYSSWSAKGPYRDLMRLSSALNGDFSSPRLIYEHNAKYNAVGTERVFEMSPYFMGRSTLESLYMQSTLLAIQVFHLQALVSLKPSCPIRGMKCPSPDLPRLRNYLQLYAVSDLILSTDELLKSAREQDWLTEKEQFGMWYSFTNNDPISYVAVINNLSLIDHRHWRANFLNWHYDFKGQNEAWLLSDHNLPDKLRLQILNGALQQAEIGECDPQVKINVSRIDLTTNCPGKAHLIKVAYHDSWVANDDSPIMLLSPGMIGIVPNSKQVSLQFGQKTSWRLALIISVLALIFCGFILWQQYQTSKNRFAKYKSMLHSV